MQVMELSFDLVWNAILSIIILPLFWVLVYLNNRISSVIESNNASIERVWKSISEHREDVPKTYVTKIDLQNTQAQLLTRFDRLEEKIDRMAGIKS
jgi:hypothetical protein